VVSGRSPCWSSRFIHTTTKYANNESSEVIDILLNIICTRPRRGSVGMSPNTLAYSFFVVKY